MSQLTQCTAALFLVLHSATSATLNVVTIPETETCPTQERRNEALQSIRAYAQMVIETIVTPDIAQTVTETTVTPDIVQTVTETVTQTVTETIVTPDTNNSYCGTGGWYLVVQLNMSNPVQQCPSVWRDYSNIARGVRGCRRPETTSGSCSATFYATSRQYSRVCGRVIGYQYGGTDAFGKSTGQTIDSYYVYGVSVTNGAPRNHIWTLAAGYSEGGYSRQAFNCPCSNPDHSDNVLPPSFVGNNYYCESGNPTNVYVTNHLYFTDPLWDGQQCEGECCSNGKSPPWFSVELPSSTTNDIEVRICIPQGSYDGVAIQLLELYVQ